ncbi:MAG: WGR domain-containing protein, partial [Chloroflexi bacterium]
NIRRAYTLEACLDLTGAWVVSVRFGRIGARGRRMVYPFKEEMEALALVRERLLKRLTARKRIGVDYAILRLSIHARWADKLALGKGYSEVFNFKSFAVENS